MDAQGKASSQELRDQIAQLHALEGAVRSARLAAVAEYDKSEMWKEDGSTSMSVWLSALTGCRQYSAKEEVRVSHALESLPALSGLFASGGLDWDKLAALTRFVTPENDREWTKRALSWSAFDLEREARRHERVIEERDPVEEFCGVLRGWWSRDRRTVKINGELPAEAGASVLAALERRADQQPKDDDAELSPLDQRMASALIELAGISIARDSDPDRATVVVHVSEAALAGASAGSWSDVSGSCACHPDLAELESGAQLRLEEIRRLACDARIEFAIHDRFGRCVGIARATRKVPPWLERQVLLAHPHCQFPGCERTSLLHCHHAIPCWEGGPTNFWNLVPRFALSITGRFTTRAGG
jgi:hypothetical protein